MKKKQPIKHCPLFTAKFLLLIALCTACTLHADIKYVFLFIGDGMGTNQRLSAQETLTALHSGRTSLHMETMPVKGSLKTRSANNPVTDSAAAGTALSCGIKTNNKYIGMDAGLRSVPNIAELAQNDGWATAILTSVSSDHATPASFYAHVKKRNQYRKICNQLLDSKADIIGGGGFLGVKPKTFDAYRKKAESKGWKILFEDQLHQVDTANSKIILTNKQHFHKAAFPYSIGNIQNSWTLERQLDFTLKKFKNKDRFFIMVEGGKIDWACHGNDLAASVHEVIRFDNAVGQALSFAKGKENETLILVTADHETGDLQKVGKSNPSVLAKAKMSGEKLSRRVSKLVEANTAFDQLIAIIRSEYGLGELTEKEKAQLKLAWENQTTAKDLYSKRNGLTACFQRIVTHRAGYAFNSGGHSDADVPLTAFGTEAVRFAAQQDNTDVIKHLKMLMFAPTQKIAEMRE